MQERESTSTFKPINLLLALSMVVALLLTLTYQIVKALTYPSSYWPMTEALINYEGGFVRRGLFGQSLLFFSDLFSMNIVYLATATCLLLYLSLGLLVFLKGSNFSPTLLISPIFLGGVAFSGNLFRKDVLLLWLVVVCCRLLHNPNLVTRIFTSCVASIGVLVHEAFYFMFIAVVVTNSLLDMRLSTRTIMSALNSKLGEVITASATLTTVLFFRGTESIAEKVNFSLTKYFYSFEPSDCCSQPKGAIDALGWDFKKAFSLPLEVWTSTTERIWTPLIWLSLIFIQIFLLKRLLSPLDFKNFKRVSIFHGICLLPLFLVGWDYGRWIFLIFNGSLMCLIFIPKIASSQECKFDSTSKSDAFMPFLGVFVIPTCCISLRAIVEGAPYYILIKAAHWLFTVGT